MFSRNTNSEFLRILQFIIIEQLKVLAAYLFGEVFSFTSNKSLWFIISMKIWNLVWERQ